MTNTNDVMAHTDGFNGAFPAVVDLSMPAINLATPGAGFCQRLEHDRPKEGAAQSDSGLQSYVDWHIVSSLEKRGGRHARSRWRNQRV